MRLLLRVLYLDEAENTDSGHAYSEVVRVGEKHSLYWLAKNSTQQHYYLDS